MGIAGMTCEMLNELPDYGVKSPWFNLPAGQEHYRLLRYLGHHFERCGDIGTYQGYSALALSEGCKNVISWDVRNNELFHGETSIDFRIGDCTKDPDLLKCDLIVLDVDHSGKFEKRLIDHLLLMDWHGTIIADDIYLPTLRPWWDSLQAEKYDITHIGHYTGTGLIYL